MKTLLFILALSLIGCSQVNTALVKNPQTGEVRECKIDPWAAWDWEIPGRLRDCVRKYEKAGWEEVK